MCADASEPAVTAEQLQARLQAQINDPDSVLRKGVVSEWLMVDQTFATTNTTCEPCLLLFPTWLTRVVVGLQTCCVLARVL